MEPALSLSTALGIGFSCGLNLYATVLCVGLGVHFGFIPTDGGFAGLAVLGEPWVLAIAGVGFIVEFFADKFPLVDSTWDAVHTFVRPIGAIVFAFGAYSELDPAIELVLIMLCGGVALASHTSKSTARLVANASPEPFSNIALSIAEDIAAVVVAVLAFVAPILVICAVTVFVLLFVWLSPKIFRVLRGAYRRMQRRRKSAVGGDGGAGA